MGNINVNLDILSSLYKNSSDNTYASIIGVIFLIKRPRQLYSLVLKLRFLTDNGYLFHEIHKKQNVQSFIFFHNPIYSFPQMISRINYIYFYGIYIQVTKSFTFVFTEVHLLHRSYIYSGIYIHSTCSIGVISTVEYTFTLLAS